MYSYPFTAYLLLFFKKNLTVQQRQDWDSWGVFIKIFDTDFLSCISDWISSATCFHFAWFQGKKLSCALVSPLRRWYIAFMSFCKIRFSLFLYQFEERTVPCDWFSKSDRWFLLVLSFICLPVCFHYFYGASRSFVSPHSDVDKVLSHSGLRRWNLMSTQFFYFFPP